MFTRRFSLKLLAPTGLVSVILVAACAFVALYLDNLNINVSAALSENVQSTQVAARLESTTKQLIRLYSNVHPDEAAFVESVREQNEESRNLLSDADSLANLEDEKALVDTVRLGIKGYLERWDDRSLDTAIPRAGYNTDADLAQFLERHVLGPCIHLRGYNTDQIEHSDRENHAIVSQLRWGLFAVAIGGPLGGLLLGYAMARSLRRSIYQLSVRIRDAAGRLNRELGSVTLDDEDDLRTLHRQMQGVIVEIERVIEELQQREREVLRAEQLAAVGQIAAGVAHELRNPLTSVKLLVQAALEEQPAAGLPEEDLVLIENEVRRMEHCIQLFLDFARPPRSQRRQTVLADVVRRALALVEGRARRQQVEVAADLPVEPTILDIDPDQIHQVLLNLLLNALDAQPRGGKVHVRVVATAMSSEVVVRVEDQGVGIAPNIRERLFEPFVSGKETGIGLGLSICKRLIEGHGGSIHAESGAHGGSVFAFTLPAGQVPDAARLVSTSEPSRPGSYE